MKPAFLIIEACDFEKHPVGGTLSFAKHMIKVFDNVALAGSTTRPEDPIGRWFTRSIGGREYPYFAFRRATPSSRRPLVPGRLSTLTQFSRHHRALFEGSSAKRVFTRTPEILLALRTPPCEDICFHFAGISNSVSLSRYPMLRRFGGFYERRLFRKLKATAAVVLAAASASAIAEACDRTGGILKPEDIQFFPTRFDDQVFRPKDRMKCRAELGLPESAVCFAVVGRLNWVKGWQLALDAFEHVLPQAPEGRLIFIGDGEDREAIEKLARGPEFRSRVILAGRQSPTGVATWLNAADVVVVASHHEGWSTAMVEALACGKPIVSTDVSGAREMIREGQNGFILRGRDPGLMAEAMVRAVQLPHSMATSLSVSNDYALCHLRCALEAVWLNRLRKKTDDA